MMQSQKQKCTGNKKPETAPSHCDHTLMREDDMASWLHYPIDEYSLETYLYSNDFLSHTPVFSAPAAVAPTSLPPPSDVEVGCPDLKKQHGGSTSTKKSRSAEVHNLSERRRRDRINEKMKTLQELIPRCNKSDKASMLDDAIEYLKSLQMQVQMMSMGCNMVPMMVPMSPMAMGMGTNRPMFPYPAIPLGPSLPNPAAAVATPAAHLSQRFPVPGFNMACPTANLSAPMMSPLTLNSQNQPRVLSFADPFQQYQALRHTGLPLPQHQGGVPLIETKPSSSKDATNPDHRRAFSG